MDSPIFAADLTIGTAAIAFGALVFIVVSAVAYIAFRLLRKSVKMALRLAVVVAIMVIGLVGGLSLWWFVAGDGQKAKPGASRQK